MSCISAVFLVVPVRHMLTTAWLSQWTKSLFRPQWGAHTVAATRTAKSSFHWMSRAAWCLVQGACSQWPSHCEAKVNHQSRSALMGWVMRR